MAKLPPQCIALLLNQEISAVVTAMRQNFRWSMVPTRYTRSQDEESGDEPLLDDFKLLRQRVFQYHDWSVVDPMEYLRPFLEVIRSQDTSGQITGTALGSVSRFLDSFILGAYNGSLDTIMRTIADAVTQCKFESSSAASDNVVLYKILQVLVSCLKCPGGRNLTDDNLIDIFHACYRIGHHENDPSDRGTGGKDLLKAASRQVTIELVGLLFSQLGSLSPAVTFSPSNGPRQSPDEHTITDGTSAAPSEQSGSPAILARDQKGTPEDSPVEGNTQRSFSTLDSNLSTRSGQVRQQTPYGMKSVHEVLSFIITLINDVEDPGHQDMASFGLELMYIALSKGGKEFAEHQDLMDLLRDDLWHALFQAVKTSQLSNFVAAGQVTLYLWIYLGDHLLLQLEAFMKIFLLWLSRGSKSSLFQEAALEVVLDLCSQSNFIRSIFVNLDCRVERSDLFEDICGHLSKTALPVNAPLGSIHINALEGLFSILQTLSRGCKGMASWEGLDEAVTNAEIASIWEAYSNDRPAPTISRRLKNSPSTGELDSPHARAKAKDDADRKAAIETALLEKILKHRLAASAEHFNLDYKKGFLYLQSIGLLEEDLKAKPVARYLRKCPGLSKQTIGELLGEHSAFYLEVLDEFTKTFNFKGMSFDRAIRLFLESFRLPGEAQKINRIVESFGQCYHQQCPRLFKNADAVYIFAYSVILLNTDRHNAQVKKKMSLEAFIKNNRGINDGENLPEDFLKSLYESISENEIKISSDSSAAFTPTDWEQIALQSVLPRALLLDVNDLATPSLDRHIFALMWQPTIAAVSVVLDSADNPATVHHALEVLLLAAKIASFHRVEGVMDNMIASLARFAAILNPINNKPALTFGENEKARAATQTMFTIANRYGDSLRTGWKQLLQIVMHIFQLGLLPPDVLALELDEQTKDRLPRPFSQQFQASGGSLWSRALSSLISIDMNESAETRPREAAASKNTAECIESCCIKDIFVDSKFLRAESLIELVKALLWVAGPVNRLAASGENSDVAEVGLELVIVVALRNRDRLMLIWPFVHDMLSTILVPEHARDANSLVRRATNGLLRVCRRLLHYKAESSAALLKSLQMVLKLDPEVAWKMAPDIAAEVLLLVENSGDSLRDATAWTTITRLIMSTQLSPEASQTALKALGILSKEPTLCAAGFLPCLGAAAEFMEKSTNAAEADKGLEAVRALDNMFQWLCRYRMQRHAADANSPRVTSARQAATLGFAVPTLPSASNSNGEKLDGDGTEPKAPDVSTMWRSLVILLFRASKQPLLYIRDACLEELSRILASSGELRLKPELWLEILQSELLPMTHEFATKLVSTKRDREGYSSRFSLALKLMSKILLQYLPILAPLKGFPEFWASVLQECQDLTRLKNEEVCEAVPETLKNMLLVMDARGILKPHWKDGEGNNLWDLTWHKSQVVSSGLTPALLGLVEEPPSPVVQSVPEPVAPPTAASTPPPQPSGSHQQAEVATEDQLRVKNVAAAAERPVDLPATPPADPSPSPDAAEQFASDSGVVPLDDGRSPADPLASSPPSATQSATEGQLQEGFVAPAVPSNGASVPQTDLEVSASTTSSAIGSDPVSLAADHSSTANAPINGKEEDAAQPRADGTLEEGKENVAATPEAEVSEAGVSACKQS